MTLVSLGLPYANSLMSVTISLHKLRQISHKLVLTKGCLAALQYMTVYCCAVCFLGYSCSVVIIGEPGVGKTAIVQGLAQRLSVGDVPDTLRDTRLISLELGLLMAGN